jgi:dephospho-CoA kinase
MNKKIIIGLVGQIACGKGVIKKYLIEKEGASDYRFSTIIRNVADRLAIEKSRENLSKLSTLLRSNFSEDIFAKAMAKDVKGDDSEVIVIDGIRRMTDIKYLKELKEFKLISVYTDKEIRYKRVVERNENIGDDKKTMEEFEEEEKAEPELEIPNVMEKADYKIVNNASWENLHSQIKETIKKIKEE